MIIGEVIKSNIIYVCMYVYMCVCIHMYVYIFRYVCVCAHTDIYSKISAAIVKDSVQGSSLGRL